MLLSEMAESLSNDLGAGKISESTIKGRLALIGDQAKAQEAEIETQRAEIQHLEKRITELEVKLRKQEEAPQEGRLEEGPEGVLKLLFKHDDDFLVTESVARLLHIEKGLAQHYCDVLYEAEMITYCGLGYGLEPKGRAYVVRFLRET